MPVTVHPLPVPGVLGPDVDLLATLLAALDEARRRGDGPGALADGDVLVVASKVVALAEGRLVAIDDDGPSARRRLALSQARRVVADHPRVLVVETSHGFVCANAGIDRSNVPPGHALLLPEDADASAEVLRGQLAEATGADVGVVVGDTFGRPWREGQVDVAIGLAGVRALRDERGGGDLVGAPLQVTVAAIADEVAGLADLVRDKATPIPFVVVRGLDVAGPGSAQDLVRGPGDDLFPAGGPTLAEHAVTAMVPGTVGPAATDPGALGAAVGRVDATDDDDATPIDRALATVRRTAGPVTVAVRDASSDAGRPATRVLVVRGPRSARGLLAAGAVLEDLRILLAGHGIAVGAPEPGRGDVLATLAVDPAQSSTTKAR